MNEIADPYVRLVLAVGLHDPDYVDAYYGPPEWKAEVEKTRPALSEIGRRAESLIQQIDDSSRTQTVEDADELNALRYRYLKRQLEAVASRVQILSGKVLSFDEESQALYDAVAPNHPDSYFQRVIDELETLLPGKGPLVQRYDAYRAKFAIPTDRLSAVFEAAIAECRKRTMVHVDVPASESFTIEYVRDKPWSGYNWYHGGFRSVIQVNTDFPVYIDRAIDLACHEGYPGHHVYNALLEKHLMRDHGWNEISVYALFSPQSLIAEGTANYGIEVAFPGDERLAFEHEVLFPLAGLDSSAAPSYLKVQSLVDRLSYAGNEAARRYLNGQIDRSAAINWLARFAMMPPERAEQRTRFFDRYRSYVINYNLGKDLVKRFVESRTPDGSSASRWKEFIRLLSTPRLPSGLRPEGV